LKSAHSVLSALQEDDMDDEDEGEEVAEKPK
jgi:hypothetical protein